MLTRFEVKNFKNFKDNFVLDFTKTKNYNFNPECVKDGVVNKAIIYGPNGIGKSNLGFAIFDIVSHLTDKTRNPHFYTSYINAKSKNEIAEFVYNFKFEENIVTYCYGKKSLDELIYEKLIINEKTVVYYDRRNKENLLIELKGAETLNRDLNLIRISVIKYIANNTVLIDDLFNSVFHIFDDFVEKMLFFRSLDDNYYMGCETENYSIARDIIEKGNLKNFEEFLNKAKIECKLKEIELGGKKKIAFDFGEKSLEFFETASNGTVALSVFYCWFMRFNKSGTVSFVFIDEFDAFYHHELSKFIVNTLKEIGCQVVITTHNTTIMSNDLLRPDCYFIMDEKEIKPITDFTNKDLREAHNIEKMYRAGAFDG